MNLTNPICQVSVPATSANLGPGFDSFGLALSCYNQFRFQLQAPTEPIRIRVSPDSPLALTPSEIASLEAAPDSNLLAQAMALVAQQRNVPCPSFLCDISVGIPLARGMGSSATAIVAGLVAANGLLKAQLSPQTLLQLATQLEGHPDNVAPALLGGCVLCDVLPDNQQVLTYQAPWPTHWKLWLVVPPETLSTAAARAVMPPHYSLNDVTTSVRKASTFTWALLQQNAAAMQHALLDVVHQPYRSTLLPFFEPLRSCAVSAGAMGAVISGAGSSVLIVADVMAEAAVSLALQEFTKQQQQCVLRVAVDTVGVQYQELSESNGSVVQLDRTAHS